MDCKNIDSKVFVKIFKALGDDTRLQIFEMLREGSLCACKIQERFNLTQPTLSHHLNILCNCELIKGEKDGKWIFYSINCNMLNKVISFVSDAKCKRGKDKCD